jgi:hypothetical protein
MLWLFAAMVVLTMRFEFGFVSCVDDVGVVSLKENSRFNLSYTLAYKTIVAVTMVA